MVPVDHLRTYTCNVFDAKLSKMFTQHLQYRCVPEELPSLIEVLPSISILR